MPTTVSPLSAFRIVSTSIPEWIVALETLSRQVSDRYAEFTRLSQTSPYTSIHRKKTNSTESLRPHEESRHRPEVNDERIESPGTEDTMNISFPALSPLSPSEGPAVSTPASPLGSDPNGKAGLHPFQSSADHAIAVMAVQHNLRRKRKSASLSSTHNAFAPSLNNPHHRSRARMSLIVYYDSAIQDGFDALVNGVKSARNTLRKGKTAAAFRARLQGIHHGNDGDVDGPKMWRPEKEGTRRTNGHEIGHGMQDGLSQGLGARKEDRFEMVDKELESAQNFCEIGAHSFLRDGNCHDEIKSAREKFDTCVQIVLKELVVLEEEEKREMEREMQREKEKASIRQREREEDERAEQQRRDKEKAMQAQQIDEIKVGTIEIDDNEGNMEVDNAFVGNPEVGTGTIEVDDESDGSSVHIDLSAFRSARRL